MGAGASASVDEGVTVDGELAKVLSASDNDLAKAADKLNRDIKRMVPKTASGRLDPTSIKEDERESVLEVLGRARRLAELGYANSWGYYRKTVDGGPAARDADELLVETRRLEEDFLIAAAPAAMPTGGASIKDLAFLATEGRQTLEPLEAIVQEAGGSKEGAAKKQEPHQTKNREGLRRRRSARRRPRARDRHLRLRGRPEPRHFAAEGRLPPGRDHDPALQGPLRPPLSKWLPRPATERRTRRICWRAPVESEAN